MEQTTVYTKSLEQTSVEDITKKLKKVQLQDICRAENLSPSGDKKAIVKRLLTKKIGRDDKFDPGRTKCKICCNPVRVKGVKSKDLKDGRVLVIRSIKCTGKHKHTYPLKEVIGKKTE